MTDRTQSLDGLWTIEALGDGRVKSALVPGSIQEAFPFYDGIARYRLCFPDALKHFPDGSVRLEFEKVDFYAEIHLNGRRLGDHTGGEEAFFFDVTDALQSENELTVRVICPNETETEGFLLNETPHRNKVNLGVWPGQSIDTGGILGHVRLRALPPIRIEDLYVRPNPDTGVVNVHVDIESATPVCEALRLTLYAWGETAPHVVEAMPLDLPAGRTGADVQIKLDDYRLWSVDEPNLYIVETTLAEHSFLRRFGFRRFEVINGYFHLNGRRVFLKCSHTGNVFPGGLITSSSIDLLRRDFLYAKSCGFNTIRFMAAMAREEQLELCDEIGLMVYDETMAGWEMADSPRMQQWYSESLSALLLRDRNHACVTICGLLNETKFGAVYETARDSLPMARALAPDMLLLLSSGRWDGEIGTGSVSNPGSSAWEPQWGLEGSGERRDPRFDAPYASWVPGMGDQHLYPPFPQSVEIDDFLLRFAEDQKPVFLSEYGHGSQNDVVQEYRKFLENGMDVTAEDASYYKQMIDKLQVAFERYHMESAYGFLEDFLQDTMRIHARLRLRNLDCVRANPRFCGYNITGLLDHALTGEGLWTYWREMKPEIVDVLRDGWAGLRWSVLLDTTLWQPGRAARIRVFLCNEDVLDAGEYAVSFRIRGPKGLAWEWEQRLTVPDGALAVPVAQWQLAFDDPGEYEFSAQMETAAPIGGRRAFCVGEPVYGKGTLYAVGLTAEERSRMRALGYTVVEGLPSRRALILVGRMDGVDAEERRTVIERITRCVLRGCNAVYLDGIVFKMDDCNEAFLPLQERGCCYSFYNWLYHVDGACKRGGLLSGISDGVLDSAALGAVYPDRLFEDIQGTDECDCAMFGCGLPRDGGTYTGLALGAYPLGSGRMVLNAFRIAENLSTAYAADRLLVNITDRYAVEGELADLPSDAQEILNRMRQERL